MERKKFNRAGNAFGSSLGGVDAVAAVVLGGSAKIPTFDAVGCPSATVLRCFVNQHPGAWWCKRCLVVIEGAIELRFCR